MESRTDTDYPHGVSSRRRRSGSPGCGPKRGGDWMRQLREGGLPSVGQVQSDRNAHFLRPPSIPVVRGPCTLSFTGRGRIRPCSLAIPPSTPPRPSASPESLSARPASALETCAEGPAMNRRRWRSGPGSARAGEGVCRDAQALGQARGYHMVSLEYCDIVILNC